MSEFVVNNTIVNIDLEPGIYDFTNESGIGKSWLCKTFKAAESYDDLPAVIAGYTYDDLLRTFDLEYYIHGRKVRYLMLDRYDMYAGKFSDYIRELSKTCAILIDHKVPIEFQCKTCEIELDNLSIKVTEL